MSTSAKGASTYNEFSSTDLKPFFFGGIASCVAEAVTFPIDTAKTRLQLQGMTSHSVEITEFFCEIKCADLVSGILSRLEALDFDFSAVLHFLKGKSYQIS